MFGRKLLPRIVSLLFCGFVVYLLILDLDIVVRICSPNFKESFIPRGGEEIALPKPTLTALKGLRELGIKDFTMKGEFLTDANLSARVVEGSWPIRYKPQSRIVVAFSKDLDQSRPFKLLWEENEVSIVEFIE